MCQEPSTSDQNIIMGESRMELSAKQELITQLKEAKANREYTFPRILEEMEKNGKFLSLSSLRRVFADGSEANAASFSYENTLLPIAEVLLKVEDVPTPDSPYAKEIDGLKSVIHVQNEEIVKLGEENFFHADYEATLRETYGENADADSLVVEGGVI